MLLTKQDTCVDTVQIITHFGHILNYVKADRAHIMMDGTLMCSGNPVELLEDIKEKGYEGCVACYYDRY